MGTSSIRTILSPLRKGGSAAAAAEPGSNGIALLH